jgi:hypothetical protein
LTAEDGYQAERSYSIASALDGTRVALTVQRLEDGEVSPYLTDELRPGDRIELRGPIGGYFVWEPSAGRRCSSRRWPRRSCGSATRRERSRPNASDPPEAEMDELMLDGNAIAGLLQEVFAVEMTTAIGTCGECGAAGPVGAVHV